jgi:hypothetical protein
VVFNRWLNGLHIKGKLGKFSSISIFYSKDSELFGGDLELEFNHTKLGFTLYHTELPNFGIRFRKCIGESQLFAELTQEGAVCIGADVETKKLSFLTSWKKYEKKDGGRGEFLLKMGYKILPNWKIWSFLHQRIKNEKCIVKRFLKVSYNKVKNFRIYLLHGWEEVESKRKTFQVISLRTRTADMIGFSLYIKFKKDVEKEQKDDYIRGAVEYFFGNSTKFEFGARFRDTDIERYGEQKQQYYAKIFKRFGQTLKLSSNYAYTKYSPEYRGLNPGKEIKLGMEVRW